VVNYKLLSESYIKEGDVFYQYARVLIHTDQVAAAKMMIDNAKLYSSANEIYSLSASIHYRLNEYAVAEENYKKSLYMVPNRLGSRYDLMQFYLNRM
jgi:tetratricopeptide (TPR) repeat protein